MRTTLADLRYAWRMLLAAPSVTLTALLALGLGIGATTAVFGVIYAFLLRPLPYAAPEQLVMLQSRNLRSASDVGVNYLDFKDWQEQAHSFAASAFFNLRWNGNLETADGATETLKTTFTTANLFDLLGVQPVLGRNLTEGDDKAGAPKVMLISHRLWKALGGREVIGHELRLDGTPRTVVGVMPPAFRFPSQSDLWVPMSAFFAAGTDRSWRSDQAIARLKPGVTLAQAQTEMSVIAERLARQYPNTNRNVGAAVVGLREHWVGSIRGSLLLLLAACGGLLAIACANVAQLLLARGAARQREFAVRAALGASRARLVRQLLTESALLGLLGSFVGVLLAYWLVQLVEASIPVELPFWITIEVNPLVLAFAVCVSFAVGLLAGTLPAWQGTRSEVTRWLKQTGGSRPSARTREVLTIAQVALSVLLLAAAGVMLRGLLTLREVHPGFDPRQVLMMEVNPTYNASESAEVRVARFNRLLAALAALPGVATTAANNSPPFVPQRPWNRAQLTAEGQAVDRQAANPLANFQTVSPDYFAVMRIPLLRGRVFDQRDKLDAPRVCVVSERLAQRIWPGEDAIGKRVKLGTPGDDAHPDWLTVIGVTGDVRHQGLDREAGPDFYNCSLQLAWKQMHFLVRARDNIAPLSLVPTIRAQVAATAPGTGAFNFVSLEKEVANSFWQPRLQSWLLGFFSVVALILAAAGLYGAMAYGVAQRTREIGIRMALGASRSAVVRLVVQQGLRAVVIGLVLGLAGAAVFSSALPASGGSRLAGEAGACFLLLCAAALAAWLPARRAVSVNPSDALRAE